MEVTRGSEESYAAAVVSSKLLNQYWITNDRRQFLPQEMADAHLKSTIGLLRMDNLVRAGCSGIANADWLNIFQTELLRRWPST